MGQSCQGGTVVADRGPSLQGASAKIEQQIAQLEHKIQDAGDRARTYAARSGTDPSAKVRAMQLLKQKKMYEQQRDRLLGTHFNVQNVEFQQEQAEIALTAARAMQRGHERLREVQEYMPVEALEELADEMQETTAELRDAQDALAREIGLDMGDTDVDGEWDRLQAEVAADEASAFASLANSGLPAQQPVHAAEQPQGRRRLLGIGA